MGAECSLRGDKDRGDGAEEALEEACTVWRAFADSMHQMEMLRAADYCVEVFDDGKHRLRTVYCCTAGGDTNTCQNFIPSFDGHPLHEDPAAPGQLWYCKVCAARYRTKFGMIWAMKLRCPPAPNKIHYSWAERPEPGWQDASMKMVEAASVTSDMTAAELLAKLPRLTPVLPTLVAEHPTLQRHDRFRNGMTLQSRPNLDWDHVFNTLEEAKGVAAEIVEV